MRLVLDTDPRVHTVRGYGEGEILIGEQRITRPCIVSARELILDWPVSSIASLTAAQLEPLTRLSGTLILLGAPTPARPEAALRRALQARGIALECMNLGAACRTYNVLVSEDRAVVAGLFPL